MSVCGKVYKELSVVLKTSQSVGEFSGKVYKELSVVLKTCQSIGNWKLFSKRLLVNQELSVVLKTSIRSSKPAQADKLGVGEKRPHAPFNIARLLGNQKRQPPTHSASAWAHEHSESRNPHLIFFAFGVNNCVTMTTTPPDIATFVNLRLETRA
ncbi:hypothetical protein WMY93_027442 [Mugilogobius chulae]|uniref:Uncharacterized protein n=1 Tax=Mugilogobius chulae TaxID=88201 RepID=A0AAW0MSX0_9GOBI